MPQKSRKYIRLLGPENRLRVYYQSEKGKVRKFSLQYESLIQSKWHTILRIDNFHNSVPHKHVYYLNRRVRRATLGTDPHKVFNFWRDYIEDNYPTIKDNYLYYNKS